MRVSVIHQNISTSILYLHPNIWLDMERFCAHVFFQNTNCNPFKIALKITYHWYRGTVQVNASLWHITCNKNIDKYLYGYLISLFSLPLWDTVMFEPARPFQSFPSTLCKFSESHMWLYRDCGTSVILHCQMSLLPRSLRRFRDILIWEWKRLANFSVNVIMLD